MTDAESRARATDNTIILTAVGRDRPGIVAAVTRVLFECGGNLEDSSMTRLAGEFAIILILRVPESLEDLDRRFDEVRTRMGLSIHLKALSPEESSEAVAAGEPWIISLYGADRPGLVYRVTELLAERGVNVTDVMTHRSEGTTPLYQLMLEVEVPKRIDTSGLDQELQALARGMGVDVSLRPMETAEL